AIVAPKLVGCGEIVGDVKIGPAVVVEVPPSGRVTLRRTARSEAGSGRDVGEGAVAVVAVKAVGLAVGLRGGIEQVGLDEDIEPAIAIVVAERGHAAGVV